MYVYRCINIPNIQCIHIYIRTCIHALTDVSTSINLGMKQEAVTAASCCPSSYMYACMYVSMHTPIFACMYVSMHINVCRRQWWQQVVAQVPICMHACMSVCIQSVSHACMLVCMQSFLHACISVCTSIFLYICMFLYKHICRSQIVDMSGICVCMHVHMHACTYTPTHTFLTDQSNRKTV
jgi:hypothetical protein